MKYHNHLAISMFTALVLLVQLTGCNLLRSGANEYNDLVALVQGVQEPEAHALAITGPLDNVAQAQYITGWIERLENLRA